MAEVKANSPLNRSNAEEKPPALGILEEDDEFEEFPVEGTLLLEVSFTALLRLG